MPALLNAQSMRPKAEIVRATMFAYICFFCDVADDRDGLATRCIDQCDSRISTFF
jgi:hypothetical protein